MAATVIDGKAFAAKVREQVAGHVTRLKDTHGITPGLAVVLVGEDPSSTRNSSPPSCTWGLKAEPGA